MHLQAMEIFQDVEHAEGVAIQYDNFGSIYAARGDRDGAREWWGKAHEAFKRIDMKHEAEKVRAQLDTLDDA